MPDIEYAKTQGAKDRGRSAASSRCRSAAERVEEYLRAETALSHYDKPPQREEETRAKYCWRLIRECVGHAVDEVSKANIKDIVTGHGIHHGRKLTHGKPVLDMLYNHIDREYLTLDGETIRVFRADGRKKEVTPISEPIDRFMFASQIGLYVGWTFQSRNIVVSSHFSHTFIMFLWP